MPWKETCCTPFRDSLFRGKSPTTGIAGSLNLAPQWGACGSLPISSIYSNSNLVVSLLNRISCLHPGIEIHKNSSCWTPYQVRGMLDPASSRIMFRCKRLFFYWIPVFTGMTIYFLVPNFLFIQTSDISLTRQCPCYSHRQSRWYRSLNDNTLQAPEN